LFGVSGHASLIPPADARSVVQEDLRRAELAATREVGGSRRQPPSLPRDPRWISSTRPECDQARPHDAGRRWSRK
jgi:hypothetical protein